MTTPNNMREKENSAPETDVSNEFLSTGESEFWDRLDRLGNLPLVLKLDISSLASNQFQQRLKRFLQHPKENQIRRVVISATRAEHDNFKDRFPGAEWDINE